MLIALILSVIIIVFLLTIIGFAAFYLLRFSRIILSIEDTLSDAILTLQSTESSIETLATKQLFFESKEIQTMVKESMDELAICRLAVSQVIKNFTNLSKQKYIITRNDDDADTTDSN